MSTEQMRAVLLSAYPGWKQVKNMKDAQVLAIYRSLQHKRKINL